MRILLATDHYPPFIGGAHRQVALLGQELSTRGHDVEVVTTRQPDLAKRERQGAVGVHRLLQVRSLLRRPRDTSIQHYHPPFADPLVAWQIRRLVRDFEPDIVHAYGWISFSCTLGLVGTRIPMIVSVRDYAYSCPTRTMVYNSGPCDGPAFSKCLGCASRHYGVAKGHLATTGIWAHRARLRNRVRGVHSISSYVQSITRRDFLTNGHDATHRPVVEAVIPSFRTDVQKHSIDVTPYLDQLPDEPFILFVGAIRRVKGVDELLAAYESLSSPPPLVVLGTLERDSPRAFPDGVHVVQDFPHDAVLATMDRCLFAAFPSLWPEPLGSVVHEAMSRGVAVIGTKPSGHEDMIVDGETGYLVPCGDVHALAAAMQALIDDPIACGRFGQAGLIRSRLFTAAETLPQFESLYREVITESELAREGGVLQHGHVSGGE